MTAMASGWMIRSFASRSASSPAAVAVVSSGYPMAIRVDMVLRLSGLGVVVGALRARARLPPARRSRRPPPGMRHLAHASQTALRRQLTVADPFHERPVVALVLVRVDLGVVSDGLGEDVVAPEIGRDRDRVAGPGVRSRQGPAAELAVDRGSRGVHL